MRRGQTYRDHIHGPPPGAEVLIRQWSEVLTAQLLGTVWSAYDEVRATAWSRVNWSNSYDDVERNLSEDLAQAINDKMDGFLPVHVMHGPFERESRAAPPAQPPQYDIAFRWTNDPRLMWPLEAKVLKSDRDTDDNLEGYLEEGCARFLNCRYAPFSNGGAMLAYLKSGDGETVTVHIGNRLGVVLNPCASFSARCHKTSDHRRAVPAGKDYPVVFTLHHLVLPL